MKSFSIIIFILCTTFTFGQTLSNEIDSIYNFKPGNLSDKEQERFIPAMDKFWEKVKGDTAKYLPALRFELMQTGHNPFFYYDGTGLLLSLSATRFDKELAVQAIAKCDLDDISQKIYVSTLNQLAQENIDVTSAAIKILQDEKFSFFIPQHAMTFNQGYCLTYMLLPQDNTSYVDTLIKIFPSLNIVAKKSIITTLWFTYSCKGDDFLKSVMTDKDAEREVRTYAKEIMASKKLTKEQNDYVRMIGKENLDQVRAFALQRFSDEAISELDLTTRVMRSESGCR